MRELPERQGLAGMCPQSGAVQSHDPAAAVGEGWQRHQKLNFVNSYQMELHQQLLPHNRVGNYCKIDQLINNRKTTLQNFNHFLPSVKHSPLKLMKIMQMGCLDSWITVLSNWGTASAYACSEVNTVMRRERWPRLKTVLVLPFSPNLLLAMSCCFFWQTYISSFWSRPAVATKTSTLIWKSRWFLINISINLSPG